VANPAGHSQSIVTAAAFRKIVLGLDEAVTLAWQRVAALPASKSKRSKTPAKARKTKKSP
jgi:hypothetical protein